MYVHKKRIIKFIDRLIEYFWWDGKRNSIILLRERPSRRCEESKNDEFTRIDDERREKCADDRLLGGRQTIMMYRIHDKCEKSSSFRFTHQTNAANNSREDKTERDVPPSDALRFEMCT